MEKNVIEQIVVPYNPPSTNVVQRNGYNLFAPMGGINKVGMVGYSADDFEVQNQILRLKNRIPTETINQLTNKAISEIRSLGGKLYFYNINGDVVGETELPSTGESGGTSGGNSVIVSDVPLTYSTGLTCFASLTKVNDTTYKARVLREEAGYYCSTGVSTNEFDIVIRNPEDIPGIDTFEVIYTVISCLDNSVDIVDEEYLLPSKMGVIDGISPISSYLRVIINRQDTVTYFPEYTYYIEIEVNIPYKKIIVRVTQMK